MNITSTLLGKRIGKLHNKQEDLLRSVAVLSKGRSSTANSVTKVIILLGMNRCGIASRCFPHPILSLASEQILKVLKNPSGPSVKVRRVDLANWALMISPNFTTGLNICSISVFDQIRDPEIQITLRTHNII